MKSSGDDSDEEISKCRQSVSQMQLVGRHFRQGSIFHDIFTLQVYDIRNQMQPSPVKYETFKTESTPDVNVYKDAIAERYGVSSDIVTIDTKKKEAVICDNVDVHIVFLSFQPYWNPRAPSSNYTAQGCIAVYPGTSVKTLKDILRQSGCFQSEQDVALFVRGQRLSDNLTVESCIEYMGRVCCIEVKKMKVSCFHRPKRKTENKCTIECLNNNNLRELKEIFEMTFGDDFPGLKSGADGIWFTQGKHVPKDDEFLFLSSSSRSSFQERGRLMIHVKPYFSFPVTVKLATSRDGREYDYYTILVCESMTATLLRSEVSIFIDHHPNSIQLLVNNIKVRNDTLSDRTRLTPNCTVIARIVNKISITVFVEEHNSGSSTLKKIYLKLYKLDSIMLLKKALADQLDVDISDLQVCFQDRELLNEKLLQDYRIREDDTLYAVHFLDSIHLVVRQPGQRSYFLTVGDFRNCTVQDLEIFLARSLGFGSSRINLVCFGRCLDNKDSLFEAGLTAGDVLLVPRYGVMGEYAVGVRRVFIARLDNSFHQTLAVEKAGMLFYANDSIPSYIIEERLSAKTTAICPTAMMLTSAPTCPPSPRGSTSSTMSLQHCYKALFGVGSSAESESGKSPLDRSPTKKITIAGHDEVLKAKRIVNRPMTKLIIPCCHSDPGSSALKRLTTCKELAKEGDKVIFRESSFYEEDVSNDSDGNVLHQSNTRLATSSDIDTSDATSPQVRSFRSPSLIFPPHVIQNTTLSAVSLELGHSWKRVALTLGLTHSDLENIEYRHQGDLHGQAFQALLLWKQRSSRLATIARLKDALKVCGLQLVADAMDEQVKCDTA